MYRDLLLITEKGGFLFQAIANGLKDAGYTVQELELTKDKMLEPDQVPDIVIIYLSPEIFLRTKVFQSLSESFITSETSKKYYLIGSPEEFTEAELNLPSEMIWSTFTRPVNVQDIITQMEHDSSSHTGLKPQILLVDDDALSMHVMQEWLSGSYRVSIINSGADALDYMTKNMVDLVLLDYEMPIMNGPAVLQAMRSNRLTRDIPVMFLTSKDDAESVKNAILLKPERYILKSMPREEFLQALENFFHK